MNHIVLDLEWNQAAHPARTVTKPLKLNGEIVQIGAVKLDEQFQIIDTFNRMICPRFYKKMHRKVSEITGITAEDLQKAPPFQEAIRDFRAWCADARECFTWGPDDGGVLRDNCLMFGMDPGTLPPCCNLQLIFNKQITGENRQVSLSSALELVGESLSDAHNALQDALGTAKLMAHLDMPKGIRDFPSLYDAVTPPSLFSQQLTKTYPSKKAALNDPSLLQLYHPILSGSLHLQPWIASSQWKYVTVGKDEAGADYFVILKLCRTPENRIRLSRNVHPLNEKLRQLYEECRSASR